MITFQQQSKIFMDRIQNRKRGPVRPATISAYRSYLDNWILQELGKFPLTGVENGAVKKVVTKLSEAHLSPATIGGILNVIKAVVKSCVDENGNCLHPRTWNSEFLDAPEIIPANQDAPTITREGTQEAIRRAPGQFSALYALLAGTGLRIGEAMALRVGRQDKKSFYEPGRGLIVIKTAFHQGEEQAPKTAAGVREIDLAPELNTFLMNELLIKPRSPGELWFQNEHQTGPVRLAYAYEINKKCGVPGFHSFRRFRMTHLENQNVPRGLTDFWMGHAGRDVHDRYVKIGQEIDARRAWAEKAGLGFELKEEK